MTGPQAGAPEVTDDQVAAGDTGLAMPGPRRQGMAQPVRVLADRLAAAVVHHAPGWRLPRQSALARRYGVSAAQVEAAVDDLVGRHLIRRLTDGQLYRAGPAEYGISLEGPSYLVSYADAMGSDLSCRSSQLSWRLPSQDIRRALRLPASQQVCVLRLGWASTGEPAAVCTTYVPADIASAPGGTAANWPEPADPLELTRLADALLSGPYQDHKVTGVPRALHVELQAPPSAVARSLRLSAGQPAILVTVRFDDPILRRPVALTTAALRADMFRLVVQSPEPPLPDGFAAGSPVSLADGADNWNA